MFLCDISNFSSAPIASALNSSLRRISTGEAGCWTETFRYLIRANEARILNKVSMCEWETISIYRGKCNVDGFESKVRKPADRMLWYLELNTFQTVNGVRKLLAYVDFQAGLTETLVRHFEPNENTPCVNLPVESKQKTPCGGGSFAFAATTSMLHLYVGFSMLGCAAADSC